MDKDKLIVEAMGRLTEVTDGLRGEIADLRDTLLTTQASLIVLRAAFVMFAGVTGGRSLQATIELLRDQEISPPGDHLNAAQCQLLNMLTEVVG